MDRKHNPKLLGAAKSLRKNMTKEERKLWYEFLREYPVKFLRQKILGNYIVDFYCAQAKLVVELDGSQHFSESNLQRDSDRAEYLQNYGIEIIRIPNNYVKENFNGVCEYIDDCVKQRLLCVKGAVTEGD